MSLLFNSVELEGDGVVIEVEDVSAEEQVPSSQPESEMVPESIEDVSDSSSLMLPGAVVGRLSLGCLESVVDGSLIVELS